MNRISDIVGDAGSERRVPKDRFARFAIPLPTRGTTRDEIEPLCFGADRDIFVDRLLPTRNEVG